MTPTYQKQIITRFMEEQGHLPNCADVGGYPLLYLDEHSNFYCGDCATKIVNEIDGVHTYFEGPPVECHECGEQIESAYGDPEAE